MKIGYNIKKFRKEKGLTQQQLGNLINKSAISIRKYEANDITPSLKVLDDIAQALNVTRDDLIGVPQITSSKFDKFEHILDNDGLLIINKLKVQVNEIEALDKVFNMLGHESQCEDDYIEIVKLINMYFNSKKFEEINNGK